MQALLAQTPTPDKINSATLGDGRNYSGYRFNQRGNELLDNITGKMDYNLSPKHAISATYAHNRDNSDRPDASNNFGVTPAVTESDARGPGGGVLAMDAGFDHHQRAARRLQPDLRVLQ